MGRDKFSTLSLWKINESGGDYARRVSLSVDENTVVFDIIMEYRKGDNEFNDGEGSQFQRSPPLWRHSSSICSIVVVYPNSKMAQCQVEYAC